MSPADYFSLCSRNPCTISLYVQLCSAVQRCGIGTHTVFSEIRRSLVPSWLLVSMPCMSLCSYFCHCVERCKGVTLEHVGYRQDSLVPEPIVGLHATCTCTMYVHFYVCVHFCRCIERCKGVTLESVRHVGTG